MGFTARVSFRHEYELFVENKIEDYKDRVPRAALLKIAGEAVERLHKQEQATLSELVLLHEVDRIIAARLRLPTYNAWVKKRKREMEIQRQPETWGVPRDAALVRNIPTNEHAHMLVAQPCHERAALFLAANGCDVVAIEPQADIIARVMQAAEEHGLTSRVKMLNAELTSFAPTEPLAAVVCTAAAFAGLPADERRRVLMTLQGATRDGGVHLVETIAAGALTSLSLDELRDSYVGWHVSVEGDGSRPDRTFVARKA